MKVVINVCHGVFSLSHEGKMAYLAKKGIPVWHEDKKYYLVPPEQRLDVTLHENQWHSLSPKEKKDWNEAYSKTVFYDHDLDRTDPDLVAVVQELGKKAQGRCAELKIVEIPDDVEWQIEEYDGSEWVAEKHRTWA